MKTSPPVLEVIPAIDLLGGCCVRLYQGDFGQVTEYTEDPVALARRYRSAGARRLHVVDLDGARTGEPVNLGIIGMLAAEGLAVQAGGGLRDFGRVRRLFDAGVGRAVIGSVAIREPEKVAGWLDEAGPGRIVLAFDVRLDDDGEPELLTHGWTRGSGQSLWAHVEYFLGRGAREFLCTDIARDGTLEGPNLALYRECVRRYPDAAFIASGGVGGVGDLTALEATGVAAVVTGKALLDGRLTLGEMEQFSQDA